MQSPALFSQMWVRCVSCNVGKLNSSFIFSQISDIMNSMDTYAANAVENGIAVR